MRKVHRIGLFLALAVVLTGAQEFPRGQVVPSVPCQNTPGQSYALYIPLSYRADRASPALFMFDPAARGTVAVEAAKNAAERHGVIVFASNNSKNGPARASYEAAIAMWDDAHARFRLDARRAYAAGFSGGARFANTFAKICENCVSAVIANGAGLPPNLQAKDIPFGIFATSGDLDFNYAEIVELHQKLQRERVPNHVYLFHGPHDWAPHEGWDLAFQWIHVQEIKRGILPRNPAVIEEAFQAFRRYRESVKSEFGLPDALRDLESALNDFEGLRNVEDLQREYAALRDSREVKEALSREKADFSRRQAIVSDATGNLKAIVARDPDSDEALRHLRSTMSSLRKSIDKSKEPSVQDRRILSNVLAASIETADRLMEKGKHDIALDLYTAVADFAKSAPGAHLGKARAFAKLGKEKDALAEAKLALDAGVAPDALRSSPEFSSLLAKPEWRDLLSSARAN